ncbi:MAG: TIGR00153 family protein [Candidatus Lokiarchaeota archaeon]|nr:TIGR00153 family protein [Candidatus Lokiarchaeota archaeon]
MGSLLEWFHTKKEDLIVKMTKEHAKKVLECVIELDNLFKDLSVNEKEKNKIIEKINKLENECDDIRRDITIELVRGILSPNIREDLAHLIKRLDNVADHSNATARRTRLFDLKLLTPIQDDFQLMLKHTIESVRMLKELIENQLGQGKVNINKLIIDINKKEHQVDIDHYNVRSNLYKIDTSQISPFTIIEIHTIIESIELIADSVEDTADYIKILNLEHG